MQLAEVKTEEKDIETLAAEARVKRQQECLNEINKVLEQYRCQMGIQVAVGDKVLALNTVLNLPVQISVVSL